MKAIQITVLAVLGVIIILLSGVLIAGLLGYIDTDFSKYFSDTELIFDKTFDGSEMKDIDIDMKSADVKIYKSDDQSIRVVYYGPESEKEKPTVSADYTEGVLNIEQKTRVQFFRWFNTDRVEIYLPEKYLGPIELGLSSGNLDFVEAFEFSQMRINLTSGNIKATTLSTENLEYVMSSGNLNCEGITSDTFSIKLTSGSFKSDELVGTGAIKASSGNISIKHFSGSGEIKLTSGDFYLGLDALNGDLDIGLTSGNLHLDLLGETDGIYCDFRVTSGNIKTNFGDVDEGNVGSNLTHTFSDSEDYKLSISAVSGSIKVEN